MGCQTEDTIIYLLGQSTRSEFLAVPHLARFDYPSSDARQQPTLLVKGSSLLMKYVVAGVPMRLSVARIEKRLLYALTIFDDLEQPATLWSFMEADREKKALLAVADGEPCGIALFNEVVTNVAFAEAVLPPVPAELGVLVGTAELGEVEQRASEVAGIRLDELARGALVPDAVALEIPGIRDWQKMKSYYVTNSLEVSELDLFDSDEGRQQEQLGIWLADNLQPSGAYASPQVPKGQGTRELTDIMLCYERGSTFIESKALSIFTRDAVPTRAKLSADTVKHVRKARAQLRGGIRGVKAGVPVTTKGGVVVGIERAEPMHAIVLVPELALIRDAGYGADILIEFARATGAYFHLLDPAELLRVVQAAEMIADEESTVTPIEAFDFYLAERAQIALERNSLCVEVLFRI